MRKVARIRVVTTRRVEATLTGEYSSVFRGPGIEFDEVREYVAGDDVRAIDWNVTARMGHPYVKRFREERELTVTFLVDVSGSQMFGSGTHTKAETSAEIACLLALTAIRNQDRIGWVLFSDRIETSLPPRRGRTAVMRLVREVLAAPKTRRGTDLAGALRFLNTVQKRRAVVFLISDFMDRLDMDSLRLTAQHHDLICCVVSDPREHRLVPAGLLEVEDPETGALMPMDTGSAAVRAGFSRTARQTEGGLRETFRKLGIDSLFVSTSRPFVQDLRKLFRERRRRASRG
jgi:uncharacterized protein (DUF58 family)